MKKTTIVLLCLVLLPATAFGWKYTVFENDKLLYQGPLPPFDLTYPPAGEPTPVMNVTDPQEGAVLSPREIARLRSEPHLIIIPADLSLDRSAEVE
jgi:hypothetical protein